jgi:hypothetical protein
MQNKYGHIRTICGTHTDKMRKNTKHIRNKYGQIHKSVKYETKCAKTTDKFKNADKYRKIHNKCGNYTEHIHIKYGPNAEKQICHEYLIYLLHFANRCFYNFSYALTIYCSVRCRGVTGCKSRPDHGLTIPTQY